VLDVAYSSRQRTPGNGKALGLSRLAPAVVRTGTDLIVK